jgi:hypothetical protein
LKIVVCEGSPLLLELAFGNVPVAFDFECVHELRGLSKSAAGGVPQTVSSAKLRMWQNLSHGVYPYPMVLSWLGWKS